MITTIRSSAETVNIGRNSRLVLIGERLNPTRKKQLVEALLLEDMTIVQQEALEQVKGGADILDVNVGAHKVDEVRMLPMVIKAVTEVVTVPLCIDTANTAALEAALKVYQGKALVNSVTAEDESLKKILPLIAEYGAAVIGLVQDEAGVTLNVQRRIDAAEKILEAAGKFGIPQQDVVIDCLTLSVATEERSALATLECISRVAKELGNNITLGASNISFGFPLRPSINAAFLVLAIGAGLTCPITNPLEPEIRRAILATELLLGKDEFGDRLIKYFRDTKA